MNGLRLPPIPAWLTTAERELYRVEKWTCIVCLLVMLVGVAASVAIRFWALALPNVAEWSLVAMSPLTFVGAAMCTKGHAHVSVDLISQVDHAQIRWLARLAVTLAMLAFAGVYAWLGWILFDDVWKSGERLLDLGTPVAVPIAFLGLGMLCMMGHCLLELWSILSGDVAGSDT